MLEELDGRRFGTALELACSVGVFTEMLAPRCDELLAVDISASAVALARERLAGRPNVRVERATLPGEFPEGSFDLVVCADVSGYMNRAEWAAVVRRIETALRPGGSMLIAPALGRRRGSPGAAEERTPESPFDRGEQPPRRAVRPGAVVRGPTAPRAR